MAKPRTQSSAPATPAPSRDPGEHVAVRLPTSTIVRLDAEAARMRQLIPGLIVTRSGVIRAVIDRGLDVPVAVAVKV